MKPSSNTEQLQSKFYVRLSHVMLFGKGKRVGTSLSSSLPAYKSERSHKWGLQEGLGCKCQEEESQKHSKSLQDDLCGSWKLRQALSILFGPECRQIWGCGWVITSQKCQWNRKCRCYPEILFFQFAAWLDTLGNLTLNLCLLYGLQEQQKWYSLKPKLKQLIWNLIQSLNLVYQYILCTSSVCSMIVIMLIFVSLTPQNKKVLRHQLAIFLIFKAKCLIRALLFLTFIFSSRE